MEERQFESLEWKNARIELPLVSRGQKTVFVITARGKRVKAMFYYNGGKPTFASYGSEIKDVLKWAYTNK